MKDILQKVYDAKEVYRKNQVDFYSKFRNRYDFVMRYDIQSMINTLEEELKYLLASCVIYKTGRISIKSCRWSNPCDAFIEQRPVVHYYHSSDDDIKFVTEDTYVNKNGDLMSTNEDGRRMLLQLSTLKKFPKQIDQVRFDVFMKYLREVLAYKNRFLFYVDRTGSGIDLKDDAKLIGNKSIQFANDSMIFSLESKRFHFYSRKSSHSNSYNSENNIMNFLNYFDYDDDKNDNGSYSRRNQFFLKNLLENYDEFISKMDLAEANKKQVVQTCEAFIDGMKKFTIPFKVLKKLV